ncbi:hypothetical protein HDU77_000238 [Chytriomyces hyalinus]|nr:hypothetical protein HDU77_000238 [Chytriomyces hyalinus]
MTQGNSSLYALSTQLEGHSQDVRALAAGTSNASSTVFSASRDTRVLRWSRDGDSAAFAQSGTYAGHSHFVVSLLFIQPSEEYPEGLIASGSADKSINVFDPRNDATPVFTLIGHTDTVCALARDEATGAIVSGSWDKTAKVWVDWQCVLTLTGHEQAVWAVLAAGAHGVLTASADKLIKVWKDGKCVRSLSGHSDAVRALAPLEGVGFLSASNDGSVRIWNFQGDCMAELFSHTSFVYGLSPLPHGGFASCGEDRTVKVWKPEGSEYKCVQTIQHPCTSVWCVTALENGDIVTGGSDAVVRIFTTNPERAASLNEVKAYDDSVAKHQIPSNQVGDVDKTKLPGLERLANPGTPDQVVMILNGDMVEAHQFNAADGQWVKIGEVVDAVGGGRKQMYNGREYDYVFDIDIGAGTNLKLPYNLSDNPYMAAQDFINRHELNQDFLDQIGTFIIQNSKSTTLGNDLNPGVSDPFTGAGRYVPGTSSSGVSKSAPAAVKPEQLFPNVFATFGSINSKGVKTKITQLNGDPVKINGLTLSSDEQSVLSSLIDSIDGGKDKLAKNFNDRSWSVLSKLAFEWPESVRFPGIDLIRICVLYSASPLLLEGDNFIPKLLQAADLTNAFNQAGVEANKMLCIRALSNLVGTQDGVNYMYKSRQAIVNVLGYKWNLSSNANLRLAVASLFLNVIIVLKQKKDDSFSFDLLTSLIEFISHESDVENEYRALVALGTLIHGNQAAQEAAGLVDLKSTLKASKNKSIDRIVQLHRAILKK